jgi:hypothetical protein
MLYAPVVHVYNIAVVFDVLCSVALHVIDLAESIRL